MPVYQGEQADMQVCHSDTTSLQPTTQSEGGGDHVLLIECQFCHLYIITYLFSFASRHPLVAGLAVDPGRPEGAGYLLTTGQAFLLRGL